MNNREHLNFNNVKCSLKLAIPRFPFRCDYLTAPAVSQNDESIFMGLQLDMSYDNSIFDQFWAFAKINTKISTWKLLILTKVTRF